MIEFERIKVRLGALLDSFTRRFRLGEHFLGVFIPDDLKGDADAVRALAPGVMRRVKAPPKCILLSASVDGVQAASRQAGLSGPPFRVALFAHPNDSETGFSVNPSPTGPSSVFPYWWSLDGHEYEFIYAHVCNGATVLNREPWAAIFPRWVSYQMVVEVFLATPRSKERWTELCTNLLKGAWQSDNVEALFYRTQAIYNDAMARLWGTFDAAGGDDITMAFLEKSIAALARRSA
jgi:hypothetical protein